MTSINSSESVENIDINQTDDKAKIENFTKSFNFRNPIFEKVGLSIEENKHFLISKLQQNVNIRRIKRVSLDNNGLLGGYAHNKLQSGIGTSACLVNLKVNQGKQQNKQLIEFADNMALQILGMKPQYIT